MSHKKWFYKIRIFVCIFFIGLGSLGEIKAKEVSPPPSFLEQNDGGHTMSNGAKVIFSYQAILQRYDTKTETATYKIGQYFSISGNKAYVSSDRVYLTNRVVNRKYLGEFSKYNGWQNPGVYTRDVWFQTTLSSGANYLIMEGQGGDAGTGDAKITIFIPRFGHDPQVHGIDGIWREGEVGSGIRTWQSLYTDGATGSSEGNKQVTSTGFFFSDEDEQKQWVAAYVNVPISNRASIREVKKQNANGSWNVVNWTNMNETGLYQIKCCTKDQADNEACGYRYVNVQPKTFTVTFQDWNGTVLKNDTVVKGTCAVPPSEPKRNGYHFTTWDKGYCNINTDLTIKAQYAPNTYTINYLGNGATSGSVVSSTHTYDVAKQLHVNQFQRIGYQFDSWNTKADGTGTRYTDQQSVINLTAIDKATVALYAQWNPITYSVHYHGNNATGGTMSDSLHTYDVAKTLNQNQYIRNGYQFIGWNTKADGSGSDYADGQAIKNLTATKDAIVNLYAKWDQAPQISAQDCWFYEDEDISDVRLMEHVQANDREDGDVKAKVYILSHNIIPHVVGEYTLSYAVSDSVGQKAETMVRVYIVKRTPANEEARTYLRFIDGNYLNTLKAQSIWRTSGYANLLQQTLSSPTEKEIWVLDKTAIEQIRAFNDTHDFSSTSNEAFYDLFSYLRR